MPHIKDIPLEKWPPGWLKLQVASLIGNPEYILMRDHEKRHANLPVSAEEMRAYIKMCEADSADSSA
jgi:hypothetical protein